MYFSDYKRLYVVVDDTYMREMVEEILRKAGYEEFLGTKAPGALEFDCQKYPDS